MFYTYSTNEMSVFRLLFYFEGVHGKGHSHSLPKSGSLSTQHSAEGGVNDTLGVNHVVERRLCVTCGFLAAVALLFVSLLDPQMIF